MNSNVVLTASSINDDLLPNLRLWQKYAESIGIHSLLGLIVIQRGAFKSKSCRYITTFKIRGLMWNTDLRHVISDFPSNMSFSIVLERQDVIDNPSYDICNYDHQCDHIDDHSDYQVTSFSFSNNKVQLTTSFSDIDIIDNSKNFIEFKYDKIEVFNLLNTYMIYDRENNEFKDIDNIKIKPCNLSIVIN